MIVVDVAWIQVPGPEDQMLSEIGLANFKLFGKPGVTITPGLISVFIGINGTG